MKIIIDEKKIKKLGKIGSILRWLSIGFLVIALIAVFSPRAVENQTTLSIYFGVLLVGVLLSSVSNSLTSRYGKSPRPDELLDKTFKGLDDKFSFYHYKTSIPHLMVGPAGYWAITPSFVDGEIVFDEKKGFWTQKNRSFLNRFLSREAFGRPDKELKDFRKDFSKLLEQSGIPDSESIELNGAVILLNKSCTISGPKTDGEILILPFDKAKDRFRKLSKTQINVDEEVINVLNSLD
jgi:hypothetical protein